jgi:hypothetical protein
MPIWEVGRASSAAPTFFDPLVVQSSKETLVGTVPLDLVELISINSRRSSDGGLGFNNPIYELWEEAQDVLKYQPLRCLVSIGTGMPGVQPVGSSLKTLFETLRAIATETQKTHERFSLSHAENTKGRYFRFNVDRGMENIGLDEYKRIGTMHELTRGYLDHTPGLPSQLEDCANKLRKQKAIFIPPQSFRRVIEMSNNDCYLTNYLVTGWDPEKALTVPDLNAGSTDPWNPTYHFGDFSALEVLSVKPKWICKQADSQINLRCVIHNVPVGSYRVVWRFAYAIKEGSPWTAGDQTTIRFHAGIPVNERQFMGRTLEPKVAWISDNLDDIIWPRLTELVKVPALGAEPVFDKKNGLWWQGARWFANGVLDVDSRQTVALMVRRLKGEPGLPGFTVFLGAELVS